MKARTMSRNSSWSWVKISRCIASASPRIVPELLRSGSFESSVSRYGRRGGEEHRAGDAGEPGQAHRSEDDARARASGPDHDLVAHRAARGGHGDRARGGGGGPPPRGPPPPSGACLG